MRPTTFLIRHGEKTLDGKELTTRGILQAKHLAKYLKKEKISKIISSTQNRAIQTAEIVNKVLKVPYEKDSRIREIYFPSESGKERKEERSKVKEFYEEVIKKNRKNILIVAHGNVNRYVICLNQQIEPKNIKITQIPTCMNIFERKESGTIGMVALNDTSHLPKKLKIRQKL